MNRSWLTSFWVSAVIVMIALIAFFAFILRGFGLIKTMSAPSQSFEDLGLWLSVVRFSCVIGSLAFVTALGSLVLHFRQKKQRVSIASSRR